MTAEECLREIYDVAMRGPLNGRKSVLKFWRTKPDGPMYVSGLFHAYDQQGIPLSVSLMQCRQNSVIPCLRENSRTPRFWLGGRVKKHNR